MPATLEVLQPTSLEEAVSPVRRRRRHRRSSRGGTIVLPDMTYGRLRPSTRDHARPRRARRDRPRRRARCAIGATTPIAAAGRCARSRCASAAAHVADREIRAAGTIGGNLCAGERNDAAARRPAGAADRARRDGALGRRRRRAQEPRRGLPGRLAAPTASCSRSTSRTRRAAAATRGSTGRTPTTTPCSRSRSLRGAGGLDGAARRGLRAPAPRAVRCRPSRRRCAAGDGGCAERVLDDVEPRDDALASAGTAGACCPTLVARAIDDLALRERRPCTSS